MLQYLIILLDDTSTSYCHYSNKKVKRKLISPQDLQAGILFAMKENLSVQFVYPDYELPQTYKEIIKRIDHSKIVPSDSPHQEEADIIIWNNWECPPKEEIRQGMTYLLRTSKEELFNKYRILTDILPEITRLNIVITDIETFTEIDFRKYKEVLASISEQIEQCYHNGKFPQLNLLTDRIMLKTMNNCNAGNNNITLAPNGKFYICPAFYQKEGENDIGSPTKGLDIKNKQLYKMEFAPICRKCDAYHCKRCVYLNLSTTLEVNTPSHEQCVVSHLERNASKALLQKLNLHSNLLKGNEIKEVEYLDPYEITKRF